MNCSVSCLVMICSEYSSLLLDDGTAGIASNSTGTGTGTGTAASFDCNGNCG